MTSGLRAGELSPTLGLVEMTDMKKDVRASLQNLDASNSCQIVFRNLTYTISKTVVEDKKKVVKERDILKNISGYFRPGRFTAIMGASGAGKTSFLNVIAGEAKLGTVSGDILVNGVPVTGDGIKEISGFVFQDDVILASMTVREAISMSATLRIPMSVPDTEKAQRVEDIIKDLGLTKCADTIIGDVHIKGVSGGERKRCAMAMEMVTNPKIMFLDEPTSGLDTFTAFSVIQTLRNLAHHRGQTYIATIHQPSSQLFRLFDDLLLLSDGRVMYYGETKNAVPYFTQHHFKCPIRSNPADYFFYHVLNNQDGAAMPSSDRSSTEKIAVTEETNTERIIRMLDVWEKSAENEEVKRIVGNPTNGGIPPGTARYKAPLFAQLSFLFDRESKDAFRDPLVLQSRLVQTIFLSLIAGLLYYKNADLPENAMGALFFISVTNVFMSAQSHLSAFGKQKAVFIREYGAGYYGLWSFFVSKVGVELPMQVVFPWLQITIIYWMAGFEAKASKYFILTGITILSSISGFALGVCLACSFSSLPVALIAAPLILLPLMLFSGLFVNTSAMPVWIRWVQYLSPIKYTFEAALKAVMDGTKAGDVLVSNLFGSSGLSVTGCCLLLLLLILFLIGLAYLNLYMLVKQSSKSAAKKK